MLNDEQFSRLAKLYMDMVFRLAFNYTKSRSEADDITQDVLIKLYRADKAFDSEAHIKHWLIRVTINECKKAFLSPWKRTVPIEEYASTLSFPSPEHSELFYAVMELPQKVPCSNLFALLRGLLLRGNLQTPQNSQRNCPHQIKTRAGDS